jgi:hypothetical protein
MNTSPPLKTFSLLEILEQTFRIYRNNFQTCVTMAALVTVPVAIVTFILSESSVQRLGPAANLGQVNLSNEDATTICLSSLITIGLTVLQAVLIYAPISYLTSETYFGRKVGLVEAFQARQNRFSTLGWGLLVLYFMVGAWAFGIAVIASYCAPLLVTLGALVYIAVAIYGYIVPVLTLENIGASVGLYRAFALGKARFWTVVGLTLTIALITATITYAFGSVIGLILAPRLAAASTVTSDLVDTLVGAIINIFLLPLMPIGLTLLYLDTRIRLEGLDTALGALGRSDARPGDVAPPPPQVRFTTADWRNLAIVTVITVLIVLIAGSFLGSMLNNLMPGLAVQ